MPGQLTIDFVLPERFKERLNKNVMQDDKALEELLKRIESIMLGRQGYLAKAIRGEGVVGEKQWRKLSPRWVRQKARWKQQGKMIDGRRVISTKIWILTGRVQDAIQKRSNDRVVSRNVRNFKRGGIVLEINFSKIHYVQYPDKMRRLFYWHDAALSDIEQIGIEWLQKHLGQFFSKENVKVKGA